jgi:hypothetical protein
LDRSIELPRSNDKASVEFVEAREKLEEITLRIGHVNDLKEVLSRAFDGFDAANPSQRFPAGIVTMHAPALPLLLSLPPFVAGPF